MTATPTARSILVDGTAHGRIGELVRAIEPLDDGEHAWVLVVLPPTWRPAWRLLRWRLADGALDVVAEGRGGAIALAPRGGGRVFIGGSSSRIDWEDVVGGGRGSIPMGGDHAFASCAPDGSYITTMRRDDERRYWVQRRPADGSAPSPEVLASDVPDSGGGRADPAPVPPAPPAPPPPPPPRRLRVEGAALDVVDTATGAVHRTAVGHTRPVRHFAWSPDGATLATSADDGRVRLLRTAGGPIVELGGERAFAPHLDVTPDGRRLCTVTSAEIALWDVATGAPLARLPSFGIHVGSAEISADGAHLLACSYTRGIRLVDLASGDHVLAEDEHSELATSAHLAGKHLVVLRTERVAGPAVAYPRELVHWVRLDRRGKRKQHGTWAFERVGGGSIELFARGATAMVTHYDHGTHLLHTYDLCDPDAAPATAELPSGAELLDARAGRALFLESGELVLRDPRTGVETARLRTPRRPWNASLSPDGDHIAVAYTDQGVELFLYDAAP